MRQDLPGWIGRCGLPFLPFSFFFVFAFLLLEFALRY
jgi:hypothetical protein